MDLKPKFLFFALAAMGKGISGSDRIFMEFARVWSKKNIIQIFVWQEGYQMCQRQKLIGSSIKYQVSSMEPWYKFGFFVNYFARVIEGIRIGLTVKIANPEKNIVYSASEFWMDCLPAFILKIRYPKLRWVAALFQTAPKPWIGFTEGERVNTYRLRAFFYWFVQLPIKPLIVRFVDFILVNNEEEKKQFLNLNSLNKIIVVLGAVNLTEINKWKEKGGKLPKIYNAVFQGRFHPQKGVLELVDIWKLVVIKKPHARLVMIGDGPLMGSVKGKVKREKLEKNIALTGYLFDGEEKYKIFSQSRLVVHPAFYDSGGMAAAEAMVFGIPTVGFDLKAFKSYYPQGMMKVKIGDLNSFAKVIIKLLDDPRLATKIGGQALEMIEKNWSWDKRAAQVFNQIVRE